MRKLRRAMADWKELRGLEGQTEEVETLLSKNNLVRMLLNLLDMKRLQGI